MVVVATEASCEEPEFISYMLTPDHCDCFFLVGNEELGEPNRSGSKMVVVATEGSCEEPEFISYMLTPDHCDCFFLVGNEELGKPERIAVVKKILLAKSIPLRAEMLARQIEDKKDIVVTDTYPETFKNLLRYVYGYDNTAILSFKQAGNLLYVAEKYQVVNLKARLSVRLMDLLNTDNICSLLNNPACYTSLELDCAIRHILQWETKRVLASPLFVDLSCDALVKVLEQDVMNVTEIDVWRAAVRWARHRADSADGEALRRELERPAKHIRVCTIDTDTFIREVVTTDILTPDEVVMVCKTKGNGERQPGLVGLSNEIESRSRPTSEPGQMIDFDKHTSEGECRMSVVYISTKSHPIELLPLICEGRSRRPPETTDTYSCTGVITVTQFPTSSSHDPPVVADVVKFSRQVGYDTEFEVPLTTGGRNIVLQPHCNYMLTVVLSCFIRMYCNKEDTQYSNEHLMVRPLSYLAYRLPSKALRYRVLT